MEVLWGSSEGHHVNCFLRLLILFWSIICRWPSPQIKLCFLSIKSSDFKSVDDGDVGGGDDGNEDEDGDNGHEHPAPYRLLSARSMTYTRVCVCEG